MNTSLNRLGIILGIFFVVGMALFSFAFFKARSTDDSLAVTGSAKRLITSDTVKWTAMIARTVTMPELKSGYSQMAKDIEIVKKFYISNGFLEKDLTISPVTMYQNYDYNYQNSTPENRYYNLQQIITIQSQDVQKVTDLAKNIQDIIDKGVIFTTQSLEYFYSKLADLRIDLLSEAVKDAKVRAEKIAESGNRNIGSLKSAGMGVVQLLPVNSVDISDYGSYDTMNIEKEAMVTVKANFTLR